MVRTTPYDSATYLTSPEDIAAYIEAAVEDGDPALIAHAEDVVARAKKMIEHRRTHNSS